MKAKLLKKLRRQSRDDIQLSRNRSTGEYLVYKKQYDSWACLYYFEVMFKTEDRKVAEASCNNLRRNYILEQLGRKLINF